ncbi:hypothetical protein [Pseudotabrizicola alkalilacus]|uniref:Uncharacterized protein n=1 Tax=Pseudotabrizicola alkalilacus TaxID=2305252 RepID=A0A411YXK3_9RHOB|nr:hypothetical protein [Pseudotabrizicola alkalilacus]RGP35469.1 hypothetical protein D1012_19755 [Pseudotabrizicola alkalilacus]
MIAAYVLIAAIGGLLGFCAGLLLGVPFWASLLFYPAGGTTLVALSVMWQQVKIWKNTNTYQSINGASMRGVKD